MSARRSAAAAGNPTATTSEEETKIEPAADASSGHVRSETLLPSARSASTVMSTASEKRITPREGTRIAALAASATEVLFKSTTQDHRETSTQAITIGLTSPIASIVRTAASLIAESSAASTARALDEEHSANLRLTTIDDAGIATLSATQTSVRYLSRAYITPCLVLISAPTKLRPRDSLAARKQLNAAPILTCVTLR